MAWTHRSTLALALALACLALVFGVTSRIGDGTHAVAGDAHYIYLAARSLAFDGDLDLTNQLRAFGDRWGYGNDPATDGWRFPPREIGPSLTMLPGLWLHHALGLPQRLAPSFAVSVPALAIAALFWLTACLLDQIERRGATELALAASLGFVVPYYAVGRVGYPHAPDAVVCAALTLALVRRDPAWRIGLLTATAVLFRLQNFLWLAWPVFEATRAARHGETRTTWRRPATIGAIALLGLLPQAWLGLAHPGSELGPIRWGLDFFDLEAYGHDLLVVLAGRHGLLSWTPLAALAIAGLVGARGPRSVSALPALIVLAGMVLLVATVRDPSAGWAFGARRLAGCTGIFALGLGLAALSRPALTHPRAFQIGTWTLVLVNLGLTALALSGRISLAP